MSELETYTLEQLQDFPESRLIIAIEGGVYDLTEFVDLHPGGREVLARFNRKDGSKAFEAVRHSSAAYQLFPKYLVGQIEGQQQRFNQNQKRFEAVKTSSWQNIKQKLFTHEDRFHIHKILGALVLGHFFVRMFILLAGTAIYLTSGNKELFHWNASLEPLWLLIFFALVHGALSLSSLQFSVPRKSSQSLPMIHALFRAHSITFALRAVVCMIIFIVLYDYPEMRMLAISMVVIATLFVADEISEKLTDKGDRFDTTASMPYWFGVSLERQKIHKYLYGYGQYLATFVCLTSGYAAILYTLAPIQGAAFGMTLIRKNLISPRVHHNIYLALLYLPVPFVALLYPKRVIATLALTWFFFELRRRQVNKYLIWVPFVIGLNIYLVPSQWWPLFIASLALSSGVAVLYNLHWIRKKGQRRIDSNNRLIENNIINEHCNEIKIRTKLKMDIQPGQHILVCLNNELERKYTPIWTEYLEETNQSLLTLRIKQYPEKKQNKELSASYFLAHCAEQTILDIHGPIGEKYYCPQKNSICEYNSQTELNSQQKNIVLISAGSGITPLFQIAQNLCALGENTTLITCDASPKHMLMEQEIKNLKHDCPAQINWIAFFSSYAKGQYKDYTAANHSYAHAINQSSVKQILEAQKLEESLVIMCGPEEWQKLIQNACQHHGNVHIITW